VRVKWWTSGGAELGIPILRGSEHVGVEHTLRGNEADHVLSSINSSSYMDDSDAIHINFFQDLRRSYGSDTEEARSLGESCLACKDLRVSTVLVHSNIIPQDR
jgi:hypothetical protein